MTPEQVVVRLRGDCMPLDERPGWCAIHESRWAFKVYRDCDALTDDIDLAEQVADAERERIAQAIEAEEQPYDDDFGWMVKKAYEVAARIARNGG